MSRERFEANWDQAFGPKRLSPRYVRANRGGMLGPVSGGWYLVDAGGLYHGGRYDTEKEALQAALAIEAKG